LKTLFEPARADGLAARYELRLRETRFEVRVEDGRLDVSRGPAQDPAATLTASPGTLQQVLWHGRSPRAGGLTIGGDRAAAARFLRLFRLSA
jgi:ubiquinone biosynthesis protein UbiJ